MTSAKTIPGVMLYLEDLEPIKSLSREDQGSLLIAILQYGTDGTLPQFEGMLAMAWAFVLPRIKRDIAKYHNKVSAKRYATYCREAVRRSEIPISHELWDMLDEAKQKQLVSGDVTRYPTADTTASAMTDTTQCTPITASAITSGDRCGQVSLSPYQYDTLRDKIGEEMLLHYLQQLGTQLHDGLLPDSNHYLTILGWWHADNQD